MAIGKTDYEEGGVTTCDKQWKTADINKSKPAERLHVKKKSRIVVPHYRQANFEVVLIQQFHQ